MVATMLVSDLVIHGWDLATATGQQFQCNTDLADATLGFVAATADQGRGMGLYGDAWPVGGQSSSLDRALAVSGRDPEWSSSTGPAPR